jgi:hypothetical protein
MAASLKSVFEALRLGPSPFFADLTPADRRPWMTLLAAVMGLVGGIVVVLVLAVVFGIAAGVIYASQGHDPSELLTKFATFQDGQAPKTVGGTLAILALVAVLNGGIAILIVLIASLVMKKKVKRSITSARRFRWGALAAGLILYATVLLIVTAIELPFTDDPIPMPILTLSHSPAEMAILVAGTVVGFILAAGAEEIVFRGWLLRHTKALIPIPWVVLLVNGQLFSAIHVDFDPNAFIARAAMGVAFCYMTWKLGGIEFSTGAHAANNILIILFFQPFTLNTPPPEPLHLQPVIECVVMLVIGVALTELVLRVPLLRAWCGVDEPAEQDAAAAFT